MSKNLKVKHASKRPELLAPAGSMEAFFAALEAGADAIYVSPKILNARAYGKNFSIGQIADLTQTAKTKGIKLFVALNSLMKENEIPQCLRLLSQLQEIGVDALIVQDLGIVQLAQKYFPSLRLHASTLMTIHNSLGVETCRRIGFSRVILARELTLKEIGMIANKAAIETEVFVHGAMCFSISGLCKFSSFFGGKSSTRGRCVQPCRRLYNWAGRKGTFFSMDDLCALELVPSLCKSGVTSLKIEGRLKPPGYVFHVVKGYRTILDSHEKISEQVLTKAMEEIQKAMGRPLTKGFYLSKNPTDLISPTRTANTGLYVGKVTSCDKGRLTFDGRQKILPGDKIRIVIRKKDKQLTARIKSVGPQGVLTLDKDTLAGNFGTQTVGALVFKTDTKEHDRKKWTHVTLTRFKDKSILKKARARADRIFSRLQEQKRSKQTHRTEPGVIFFLKNLDLGKRHSKKRYPLPILLPLSRKNLGDAQRMFKSAAERKNVIWHLPPICFEQDIKKLGSLVDAARKTGFYQFQISNLGHLHLPLRGCKLTSSYELNVLNSRAIEKLQQLGIQRPQFSVETDIKNMKEALNHTLAKVSLTVYGFIPLFTTRLQHRTYQQKKPVESQRKERFFWHRGKDYGCLYPSAPVSFVHLAQKLVEIGVDTWIVDLRFSPGKKQKNFRIPSSWRGLKNLLRGRRFNMDTNLE